MIQAGIWQHYKGGFYQVLGIGEHSETNERMVVYVALEHRAGPRIRIRPLSMWEELVDREMLSGTKKVPRFSYVGDEIPEDQCVVLGKQG